MNIIQAFIWNSRTYDLDDKGKAMSKDLTSVKVPMQGIGAEQFVVAMKIL